MAIAKAGKIADHGRDLEKSFWCIAGHEKMFIIINYDCILCVIYRNFPVNDCRFTESIVRKSTAPDIASRKWFKIMI